MATLSLDNQLQQYWPLLAREEKRSMLAFMKSVIKAKEPPYPQRLTIEQYNKELEEAEARIDAGEFISHEDAKEIAKTWFQKNSK